MNLYDDATLDMKQRFTSALTTLLQEKASNTHLLSKDKYFALLDEVKQAKVRQRKESTDYKRLKKYDVLNVEGQERLIVPLTGDNSMVLYYVHAEELFDVLHNTHFVLGHKGRTQMERELQNTYKNITKEVVVLYLRECRICQSRYDRKSVLAQKF